MLAFLLGLLGVILSSSSGKDDKTSATPASQEIETTMSKARTIAAVEEDDQSAAAKSSSDEANTHTTPKSSVDTPPTLPEQIPTPTPSDPVDTPKNDPEPVTSGERIAIDGGRVNDIQLETTQTIQSIEIIAKPEHGNVTVSPDNTISIVMSGSDFAGEMSLQYKVTFVDGSSETQTLDVDVAEPTQAAGWGAGRHYMLEENENGDIIVETGENHRKVYVSESDDALSRADIAALEGLNVSQITTDWLVDHPEYGGSEGLALKTDVGMDVWRDITIWTSQEPVSHWLMFESGYEYDDEALGRVVERGTNGESELHPVHITSWGDGEKPVLSGPIFMGNEPAKNIVFSDLNFTGEVKNLTANQTLFSDVGIYEKGIYVQNVEGFTLHDSELAYVGTNTPVPEGDTWYNTRVQGMYSANTDSILIEGSIIHHNGWEADYELDSSTTGGLPPSNFSHNIYLQNNTTDVTIRDNIISEGSSFGAHVRGGGYIEDNAFIDNNYGVDFLGGIYKDEGPIGNYTLFTDNVVTSAAYKYLTSYFIGGVSGGFQNGGVDSTLNDNIVAHLADPNDPNDILGKDYANYAILNDNAPVYDDTIVYNWAALREAKPEQNTQNLDRALADETTIQNLAQIVMGEEATITEFMDYLLGLSSTEFDDVFSGDDVVAYFQNGFGVTPDANGAFTDHVFIPSNIADGIRWDNRLNWSNEDVPDHGDNVDLNGNWVQYGATTKVNNLDLGSDGKLAVNNGQLTVDGDLSTGADGGEITTNGAGQFWTDGYSHANRLTVNVDDGRFANTGNFTGATSIEVNDGQAILATDGAQLVLQNDSELRINGSDARVGFDGQNNGVAVMQMDQDAVLTFAADSEGFSTLEEFRSGKWGDQDNAEVKSGVSIDGALRIDLSSYASGTATHTLVKADALDGIFDDIHIHGLGNTLNARVITDYVSDELRLELTTGSGQVSYDSVGSAGTSTGENAALWSALTAGKGTYDEGAPILHDDTSDLPELMGL